ncbi:ElaA protein [Elusimicrobium simillimum]|uniref:GNAT family N-acetyltransferase n=1 Tax=Elusimicrobium simillimum TaxID=3143438 RepID=UPI003C6FB2BA
MENKIVWHASQFDELDIKTLYAILRLRAEVFVVEQNCPYQDLDDKDQKACHVYGIFEGDVVAYCRVFKPGDYFENATMGRVIVAPKYRGKGLSPVLIQKAFKAVKDIYKTDIVEISGQHRLQRLYESCGFKQESGLYLEDNILHIKMVRR